VCAEATVKEAFTPVMAAVSLVPVVGLATTKIAAAAGSAERVAEFQNLYNSIAAKLVDLAGSEKILSQMGTTAFAAKANRSGFVRLV